MKPLYLTLSFTVAAWIGSAAAVTATIVGIFGYARTGIRFDFSLIFMIVATGLLIFQAFVFTKRYRQGLPPWGSIKIEN